MKSNKDDNSKNGKEKMKDKEKGKVKEKDNQKDNKKEKQVKKEESDSEEYYTPEEIVLLDKYHDFCGHKFEDDEIYQIILKHKHNDDMIKNELNEMLKELKRGEEFSWTEIGKSKYIFFNFNQ